MTDMRVRAGEEERLAPIVGPTHEVRRCSVAAHLDDLAVSHMTAEIGGGHHDAVAHCCFHRCSLSCGHVELDSRVQTRRLHLESWRFSSRTAGAEARNDRGPSSHTGFRPGSDVTLTNASAFVAGHFGAGRARKRRSLLKHWRHAVPRGAARPTPQP